MFPPIELARRAIQTYLESQTELVCPPQVPALLAGPGAAFVTLYSRAGELRGCRGTIRPTQPRLAEEIIRTAILSATDDPRFEPVALPEVPGLRLKIDVLSALEPVTDPAQLDAQVYGVLVRAGGRQALLLPAIPRVQSVAQQLEVVRRKAGLTPDMAADLYRFTVDRYVEAES